MSTSVGSSKFAAASMPFKASLTLLVADTRHEVSPEVSSAAQILRAAAEDTPHQVKMAGYLSRVLAHANGQPADKPAPRAFARSASFGPN
jgi:hypothetical protein